MNINKEEYTNVLLGLRSLTTGVVFSFQSSMTSRQPNAIYLVHDDFRILWFQRLYIYTQCALTAATVISSNNKFDYIHTKRKKMTKRTTVVTCKSWLEVEIEISRRVDGRRLRL